MKNIPIIFFLLLTLPFSSISKSQDYARHLELSLLFYECQRSGALPKDNRIYWRHDSMLDAGKDVELDLSGGYYDAGDNCKFNFPMAGTLTIIAWSAIDFADAYKKSNQYKYVLDMVKWGTDYFIKCHPEEEVLYISVGHESIDHSFWYPPEYMNYKYPSFKIDKDHPGTDIASEFAASLAAASILFKDEDVVYSDLLLKHAIEIYDFADKYRGSYTKSVPEAGYNYASFYYYDELAWASLWLYRATQNEKYREKFEIIENTQDDYSTFELPMSWADKYPGTYVLAAQLFPESKYMIQAQKYTQKLLDHSTTPGGLYYNSIVSRWGSNRHAGFAAATTAFLARILSESNPTRQQYINFVQKQIDYILGDNPLGINYVVGAEDNSPKSVHHRGASCTNDIGGKPEQNVFTLWGALAGGPGEDDSYEDDRSNYEKNEIALDYNAGFTAALAGLIHFGLSKEDPKEILEFDRAWPMKSPIPDIRVEMTKNSIKVASGSGLLCAQFCVYFTIDKKIKKVSVNANAVKDDGPEYIICNGESNGYLDGQGTYQTLMFKFENATDFVPPEEFTVLCDGFYSHKSGQEPSFKPDFGHMYKIEGNGGVNKTIPLFENSKCWPSFVCDEKTEAKKSNFVNFLSSKK